MDKDFGLWFFVFGERQKSTKINTKILRKYKDSGNRG